MTLLILKNMQQHPLNNSTIQSFSQKGQEIYRDLLETAIIDEKKYEGQYIAIDIDSKRYFINEDLDTVLKEAKKEIPEKIFYTVKIGYPGIFSVAGYREKRYAIA